MHNMAEHVDVVLAITMALGGAIWYWLNRRLNRLEDKMDNYAKEQSNCRANLAATYVTKDDFRDERNDLWDAIYHHDHNGKGGVVRK